MALSTERPSRGRSAEGEPRLRCGLEIADDDRQEVVEIVRDASRKLADALHLLRLRQLLLRALQRHLRLPPFRDVAGDLGKTEQAAVLVEDAIYGNAGPELRPVLADPQPFGLELALALRRFERAGRHAGGAVLRRVEILEASADDLGVAIALDALRAGIPVADDAGRVQHEERVVPDAFDQELEAPFGPLALLRFFHQLGIRGGKLGRAFGHPRF